MKSALINFQPYFLYGILFRAAGKIPGSISGCMLVTFHFSSGRTAGRVSRRRKSAGSEY